MNKQTAENLIKLTTEGYNQIASLFSQTRQYSWRDFDFFKNTLQGNDLDILDIGCGNGRIYDFVKDNTNNYVGVDISKSLLDEANSKYPNQKFIEGNVLDDLSGKLENQKFDVIFSIAMLNHIPSKELQRQALQNMFDLLKPGGKICMTNWNLWRFSLKKKSVFKFKFIISERLRTKKFLKKYDISHLNLKFQDIITIWKSNDIEVPLYYYAFTPSEIKNLAQSIGFKVIENKFSQKKWYNGGNIITILEK